MTDYFVKLKNMESCSTCIYHKKCPIQRADDIEDCKPKYYVNSVWKLTIHPSSFEKARINHE